ncbi:XRE family transcriptional regulator [uncultured Lactobacillus sp.]|uniref:XRE family transcriptional regulator n=1 Tax=uncultured Lactobacillus sp. TaxID=153152 RepID=UPI0025EE0990|nr:XRE family transcriptional regulator [uncultured Lactobacillus sp.]
MTVKQELNPKFIEIGKIIKKYRNELLPQKSREYFIEDRILANILPDNWISEKSLMNIENGRNLPSLTTLMTLSIALECDFIELIKEIKEYLYPDYLKKS